MFDSQQWQFSYDETVQTHKYAFTKVGSRHPFFNRSSFEFCNFFYQDPTPITILYILPGNRGMQISINNLKTNVSVLFSSSCLIIYFRSGSVLCPPLSLCGNGKWRCCYLYKCEYIDHTEFYCSSFETIVGRARRGVHKTILSCGEGAQGKLCCNTYTVLSESRVYRIYWTYLVSDTKVINMVFKKSLIAHTIVRRWSPWDLFISFCFPF